MRLLSLELKRVLKTRMTVVFLILSLILTFVMAYLPVTFSQNSYMDENGNKVVLKGMDSVRYEKNIQSGIAGEVTPEKLRKAVEDYQTLLAFLLMLFCAAIAAPVFTSDYQTGADDILRCTKHGKTKLAAVKIISAFLISADAFSICAVIYILVSNSIFGWQSTKTSMQILYSIVNLLDMNIGQLQIFMVVGGLLCILATVSFTLFLSSKFKNVAASMSVALVFCILPFVIYMALPSNIGHWIYGILPSGGTGLQTSIMYAAIDFDFWNIGSLAIWLPFVMLTAYIIEIPLFAALTIFSYSKHKAS